MKKQIWFAERGRGGWTVLWREGCEGGGCGSGGFFMAAANSLATKNSMTMREEARWPTSIMMRLVFDRSAWNYSKAKFM